MDEYLCTGCLCPGRKLQVLSNSEDYHTYGQILSEIQVYDMSRIIIIRICWECRAVLRRFQLFKEQVKRSYMQLIQCIALPAVPRLSAQLLPATTQISVKSEPEPHSEPHVETCTETDTEPNLEPLTEPHPELEIKSEPEDTHNDTAFADELSACEDSEEYQPKKIPTIKKKSKKKIKEKKTTKKLKVPIKKRKKRKKETAIENNDNLNENVQEEGRKEVLDVTEDKDVPESGLKLETELQIPPEVVYSKVVKLDEKPKCAECGKIFSSKKTYRYHVNVLHGGNNRHECPRCDKVYQWRSNLGRHLRTHKAVDAGELHCELCDKSFASVATYRQHMKISRRHVSENDFTFVCNECGKKFVNKTRLRDHIDWEHLKKIKYKCVICNKPFKCHTSLYLHMQNVHTNKEKKDNLCHVCGKSYQNAAKLKYHITAMHSGESPYRCTECGAAFGWYSSLYRHLRELHYKTKVSPKKCKRSKKLPELLDMQVPIVTSQLQYLPPVPN